MFYIFIMEHNNILPVVLAGGKSKRFGEDKSQAKLGGKILIDYILEEIIKDFNEVLIVANSSIQHLSSEKIIQIDTTLKYLDTQESPKKSFFEMVFSTVIRLNDGSIDKTELTKIVLIDVQKEIYPDIEKTFLNVMHGSGYPDLTFTKKIDFEELYKNNQS